MPRFKGIVKDLGRKMMNSKEVCTPFEHMKLIINEVGGNFGLNFDLGHAMMMDRKDEILLEYIEHFQRMWHNNKSFVVFRIKSFTRD